VIIEAEEVPDGVLDALLNVMPPASGIRNEWRQALAAALTAWENRPRDLMPLAAGHDCTWRTVGVQHRDMVFGVKQTDALQRCDGCGDVRTQVLTGTWALDQLRS
jgi:hypothetical protein